MRRNQWTHAAAVALGLLFLPVAGRADEEAAVKTIVKLGGRVTVDDKQPGKPVVAVDLSRTYVPLRDDLGIGDVDPGEIRSVLRRIRELERRSRCGNMPDLFIMDANKVKEFKQALEQIVEDWKKRDRIKVKVTDAVVKELKPLKSLQWLNLADAYVTDAGLKEISHVPNLQSLNLAGTEVTDAGLKQIKQLKNLQSLNLADTKVPTRG
jgi:hypothetical protein